jgi:hypothetical protein
MDEMADNVYAEWMCALCAKDERHCRGAGNTAIHSCYNSVNWYEPECDCPQCSERARRCLFRKIDWGQDEDKPPNQLGGLYEAESLDPLEVWTSEKNDVLGETY